MCGYGSANYIFVNLCLPKATHVQIPKTTCNVPLNTTKPSKIQLDGDEINHKGLVKLLMENYL